MGIVQKSESITQKAYPSNLNIIDPPVRERFAPHEQEHIYCLKETNHSNFFTKYLLQGGRNSVQPGSLAGINILKCQVGLKIFLEQDRE